MEASSSYKYWHEWDKLKNKKKRTKYLFPSLKKRKEKKSNKIKKVTIKIDFEF